MERRVAASREISFDDVIRAGRVLFGPGFAAEEEGWRAALRAAFRRRALETHPDRAGALGRPEGELAREFETVTEAYRILSSLGADPARAPVPGGVARPRPRPVRAATSRRRRDRADATQGARGVAATRGSRVHAATLLDCLPPRKLRFAEYLYYSGRVRWTDLADAIAWQRAQRPPFGRIAVELGVLAPEDVGLILDRRRAAGASGIPFGEWAVRLGYLTPFELLAILGRQRKGQRRIGEFFVERGLLGADDAEAIRLRMVQHNLRWAAAAQATRAPRPAR